MGMGTGRDGKERDGDVDGEGESEGEMAMKERERGAWIHKKTRWRGVFLFSFLGALHLRTVFLMALSITEVCRARRDRESPL